MRNLKKKEKKEARTLQFNIETNILYHIPACIPSLQTVFCTVFSVFVPNSGHCSYDVLFY